MLLVRIPLLLMHFCFELGSECKGVNVYSLAGFSHIGIHENSCWVKSSNTRLLHPQKYILCRLLAFAL